MPDKPTAAGTAVFPRNLARISGTKTSRSPEAHQALGGGIITRYENSLTGLGAWSQAFNGVSMKMATIRARPPGGRIAT